MSAGAIVCSGTRKLRSTCCAHAGSGSCVVGGISLFSFAIPPPALVVPVFLGTA